MIEITYPKLTWFTGRNGTFKSKGISINKTCNGHLHLIPITSKNKYARCEIVIHKDSIKSFIKKIKEEMNGKT